MGDVVVQGEVCEQEGHIKQKASRKSAKAANFRDTFIDRSVPAGGKSTDFIE
jgi:hypothetical protein